MRRCLFLLAGVALLAGGAAAQNVKSPQAAGYTQLFMSPCGEPYRGRVGDPYPVAVTCWTDFNGVSGFSQH